ncbi:unnamed protein product [Nippostrongylus brasiliensis]|uniref:T2SS-T3SS_pil_N domain-containing protein n=1 Tax=Nippostrongylus brasiliensis TaxID=27835 RepID=A0A0N4YBH4_NIPBR|nr:hypothetical protein Q1695_015732 [Nippostrongylus brasiliensis]VDL77401.1 unnamed protein product [Nippostrongylus brasiliensis]
MLGTLNYSSIDAHEVQRLGYTEELACDTILAPYADSVYIPGPTKVMTVIIVGSSRSIADTVIVGPAGNSVFMKVKKPEVHPKPVEIHTNLLKALTGTTWETWPDAFHLINPGEDE